MKVSDYIANFLKVQKTSHVFEVAGGMITHFLDSIYQLGNTHIISMHHEQATAFAADAYGRCTGRPGVAFATSGPGATNLLTGIGSCYFDSSPALFITGQVNTYEQKGTLGVRQLGFQETDIVSMATPITKKCFKIENSEEIESAMQEAYSLAINGRPGPVLIDIPMNIQRAEISPAPITYITKNPLHFPVELADHIDLLVKAIGEAKRPLILAGQGVSCADATKDFMKFVDSTQIPVVTSLLAVDLLSFRHPSRVGLIGSYGNRWANLAMGLADLLIVIGSRLDIRQTGAHIEGFKQNKMIFHVDCDPHEINNRIKDCIPIVSDAKTFLIEINKKIKQPLLKNRAWLSEIEELRLKWSDLNELKNFPGINPNHFMHELSEAAKGCTAFLVDVGNHQMWAAQSLELQPNQRFITSGGMGAMGFSLPAAIGYSLALGKKPVMTIVGDGSFQMNIQELQTIVRNKLPIKIVIINNQALGMIRQFQDSYFEGRYQSTYWGYSAPNFVEVAKAYGIDASSIASANDISKGIKWLCSEPDKPTLLEVMIDPYTNVYPKIAFGKPITEMEPYAVPDEMEGT